MSEKDPIVSVIMPVYNGERFVAAAIDSILGQTYRDFEFIIINDGSSDKSEEMIRSYKDTRIHYLKNEKNLGIIQTLNKGIDAAKGKYLVRMDADDISLPLRIEKQVAFMDSHPEVGAAGTDYYAFTDAKISKVHTYTEHELLRSLLIFKSCLCHPSVILRKSVLISNNIRYREFKHAEDYDLWVQLSKVSKLSNVKGFLLKYRHHPQQSTLVHTGTLKNSSEAIRESYLKENGFSFSEKELEINTLIANNTLITSEQTLHEVESWLKKLVEQNDRTRAFDMKFFNFLIGKTWYDSCGITNLGLPAFKAFFNSPLAVHFPLSSKLKLKLAAKCTIRRFRK